jgi:hypothetical protein
MLKPWPLVILFEVPENKIKRYGVICTRGLKTYKKTKPSHASILYAQFEI